MCCLNGILIAQNDVKTKPFFRLIGIPKDSVVSIIGDADLGCTAKYVTWHNTYKGIYYEMFFSDANKSSWVQTELNEPFDIERLKAFHVGDSDLLVGAKINNFKKVISQEKHIENYYCNLSYLEKIWSLNIEVNIEKNLIKVIRVVEK